MQTVDGICTLTVVDFENLVNATFSPKTAFSYQRDKLVLDALYAELPANRFDKHIYQDFYPSISGRLTSEGRQVLKSRVHNSAICPARGYTAFFLNALVGLKKLQPGSYLILGTP